MAARIGGPIAYTPAMASTPIVNFLVVWTGKQGDKQEAFERQSDAARFVQSLYRSGITATIITK